jgi:hypothetical protein
MNLKINEAGLAAKPILIKGNSYIVNSFTRIIISDITPGLFNSKINVGKTVKNNCMLLTARQLNSSFILFLS